LFLADPPPTIFILLLDILNVFPKKMISALFALPSSGGDVIFILTLLSVTSAMQLRDDDGTTRHSSSDPSLQLRTGRSGRSGRSGPLKIRLPFVLF